MEHYNNRVWELLYGENPDNLDNPYDYYIEPEKELDLEN